MKLYVLYRLVEGKWLPVLTSPDDCPSPILVTVLGPKNLFSQRDWIQSYCDKNAQNPALFKLVAAELSNRTLVGAGL